MLLLLDNINGIFIGLFWDILFVLFVLFVKYGNGNECGLRYLCKNFEYIGGVLMIITTNNNNNNNNNT